MYLLNPDKKRYTLFPIQHEDLWNFYKKLEDVDWRAEEMDFSRDLEDWNNKLNDNERYFLENVLAFFAASDK